jgi:hypothetical protein
MIAKTSAAGMGKPLDAIANENDDEKTLADALVDLAKARSFDGATLADDLLRAMLEQFRHRPKPFDQMTADEQSDVVAALKESASEFVAKALKLFAADDRPHVEAKVKSIGADGSKTKMVLEIHDETPEDIADIYRVLTKDVVVILADSNDYMSRGSTDDLIEPNQRGMEFDADDNSDDD